MSRTLFLPPPPAPAPSPSLLQQISSLREDVEGGGDPAGGLTLQLGGGEQPARPGLIQVISSSESPLPLPRRPPHRLTLQAGAGDQGTRSLELSVELPGIHSVAECQLSITQVLPYPSSPSSSSYPYCAKHMTFSVATHFNVVGQSSQLLSKHLVCCAVHQKHTCPSNYGCSCRPFSNIDTLSL
ncbi:PIH1 domain-containing protein 2-like [Clupea harengus]|uniref:PIH1 domain-containing protein 2-like n=1 Tax=Clupea harengus TaxID=7950 RepID=A0A8M1KQV5_CLUHA|nr:PIH1 domain-containing protein 2-like [Clupea harengus]